MFATQRTATIKRGENRRRKGELVADRHPHDSSEISSLAAPCGPLVADSAVLAKSGRMGMMNG